MSGRGQGSSWYPLTSSQILHEGMHLTDSLHSRPRLPILMTVILMRKCLQAQQIEQSAANMRVLLVLSLSFSRMRTSRSQAASSFFLHFPPFSVTSFIHPWSISYRDSEFLMLASHSTYFIIVAFHVLYYSYLL